MAHRGTHRRVRRAWLAKIYPDVAGDLPRPASVRHPHRPLRPVRLRVLAHRPQAPAHSQTLDRTMARSCTLADRRPAPCPSRPTVTARVSSPTYETGPVTRSSIASALKNQLAGSMLAVRPLPRRRSR